jgi:D-glycero-D-manno-heptose 1,7-bisphosphate phosphatase
MLSPSVLAHPSSFILHPSPRRAVFLDRDGVLNRCFVRGGVTHPPAHLGELEVLPGVPEALGRLAAAGFALVVVTNQPDVARGACAREIVEAINARLLAELPLLAVLTCYHDTADGCPCRKPRPGMLLEAASAFGLLLPGSYLVGDRPSDVLAGQAAGCRSVLIATAHSGAERCRPDATAGDLAEAARWILSHPVLIGDVA